MEGILSRSPKRRSELYPMRINTTAEAGSQRDHLRGRLGQLIARRWAFE